MYTRGGGTPADQSRRRLNQAAAAGKARLAGMMGAGRRLCGTRARTAPAATSTHSHPPTARAWSCAQRVLTSCASVSVHKSSGSPSPAAPAACAPSASSPSTTSLLACLTALASASTPCPACERMASTETPFAARMDEAASSIWPSST
eukprot:scaffold12373_cov97-Isochrysis_galbana.AAC.4